MWVWKSPMHERVQKYQLVTISKEYWCFSTTNLFNLIFYQRADKLGITRNNIDFLSILSLGITLLHCNMFSSSSFFCSDIWNLTYYSSSLVHVRTPLLVIVYQRTAWLFQYMVGRGENFWDRFVQGICQCESFIQDCTRKIFLSHNHVLKQPWRTVRCLPTSRSWICLNIWTILLRFGISLWRRCYNKIKRSIE